MNDITEQNRHMAKFVAIVVRNALEDFHAKYLTDAQMAELNPIIRNAIGTINLRTRQPPHPAAEHEQSECGDGEPATKRSRRLLVHHSGIRTSSVICDSSNGPG